MVPILKISETAQFRDSQLDSVGVRSVRRIDLPLALHLLVFNNPLVDDHRRHSGCKAEKTSVVPLRREFPDFFAGWLHLRELDDQITVQSGFDTKIVQHEQV